EKGVPATPIDEGFTDEVGLQSPSPIQKNPCPIATDVQNGESTDEFIEIKVNEASRVGDGMGAYVTYQVDTKTNIHSFNKNFFSVKRRFSDFLGLHDKLVEKHLRAGRIIPPAPEKSVIGMTKIKMSGQNDQSASPSEFIKRRRASLERYLQRTADHPVLKKDPDFREFLELEGELPKSTNTSALSGAAVMRLFNKVGETVNKITYKMDKIDQWFEDKTQEVECLESGLKRLQTSVEALVIARKELATYTGALAKSCALLSSCEEHPPLRRCLAHLSDLEEKIEVLHNDQARTDFSVLSELLKDYIALFGAIKEVFHERVKVYQHWQHSKMILNKKQEYKSKMEHAKRADKENLATSEIEEWDAKVDRCKKEFNNISEMIKKEMNSFEINRTKDFKSFFIKYMEDQMKHQQQVKYCMVFIY
ncbi:hypothetical protein AAG570_008049, partial [Ranatra chinensis]